MLPVLPGAEVTQMVLVGTLELVTLYVIWFLERSGRNRRDMVSGAIWP